MNVNVNYTEIAIKRKRKIFLGGELVSRSVVIDKLNNLKFRTKRIFAIDCLGKRIGFHTKIFKFCE